MCGGGARVGPLGDKRHVLCLHYVLTYLPPLSLRTGTVFWTSHRMPSRGCTICTSTPLSSSSATRAPSTSSGCLALLGPVLEHNTPPDPGLVCRDASRVYQLHPVWAQPHFPRIAGFVYSSPPPHPAPFPLMLCRRPGE